MSTDKLKIIIMDPREFKRVLSGVLKFASKDDNRDILQFVRFSTDKLNDHRLTIEAVNGFYLIRDTVWAESDDTTESNIKDFHVHYSALNTISKMLIAEIEVNSEEIRFITKDKNIAVIRRKIINNFLNFDNIFPKTEPTFTINFNPTYLLNICQAFKNEKNIRLEFHGEVKPLIVHRNSGKDEGLALLLPLRP